MFVAQIRRQSFSRDYTADPPPNLSPFATTAFPYMIEAE